MEGQKTIRSLRKAAGLTQAAFADYFGIPLRTIEDWETMRRSCTPYLINLIEYKLIREGLIDHKGEKQK